jgi:hypothetical protein
MPKHYIEFKLPEEINELYAAIHGIDYFCSLYELDQYLTCQLEDYEKLTSDQISIIENIRDKLLEIMDHYNINMDIIK